MPAGETTHGNAATFASKRAHRAGIYAMYQLSHQADKVEHFLASLAVVIAVFALLWRQRVALRVLAGIAASMTLGLAKEVADGTGLWPWCPPCVADWDDALADALGIVAACVLLLGWVLCMLAVRRALGYRAIGPAAVSPVSEV